jgi:hypothetical protein
MAVSKRRLKTWRKKQRIYTDETDLKKYFTVECDRAKKDVVMLRSDHDALTATKGSTIACMNANCAMRQASLFPHPVYLVAFTRGACYVVDRINKGGVPIHAVAYEHSNSKDIGIHDKVGPKKLLELGRATKTITLRAPRNQAGEFRKYSRKWTGVKSAERTGTGLTGTGNKPRITPVPHGAKRRAIEAGIAPIVFQRTGTAG